MVIMRRRTPARVNNLPYCEKELANESRNRKCVHVFLNWYWVEFNNITTLQQRRIIGNNYNHHHNNNNNDDEDDDDDNDVIFRYPVITRAGFVFWGLLSQRMKQSWKDRAIDLNQRPVPDLLSAFPNERLPGNLEDMVIEALRTDFTTLSTTMHRYINREPRIDVNIHKVIKFFRPHEFVLILQTIRRNIAISKLLMNYLFGVGYNRLEQNVIKSTPKTVLCHIASTERAKEVFNIAGLCSAQVFDMNDNFIRYSFCGKVILSNVFNGREIRGYILEEAPQWKVQLTNNTIIYITPPVYDYDNNMWMFEEPCVSIRDVPYRMEVYAPIRILLSKRCYISYTTHRHVCEIGPHTRNRSRIDVGRCS